MVHDYAALNQARTSLAGNLCKPRQMDNLKHLVCWPGKQGGTCQAEHRLDQVEEVMSMASSRHILKG